VDETSFVKKGNASVGVQRQYCGRLGKLENCQVGVFGCMGREERGTLIDYRLFLPQEWVEDPERCAKAKVPEEGGCIAPRRNWLFPSSSGRASAA
jgi:SRSO17 transposase